MSGPIYRISLGRVLDYYFANRPLQEQCGALSQSEFFLKYLRSQGYTIVPLKS